MALRYHYWLQITTDTMKCECHKKKGLDSTYFMLHSGCYFTPRWTSVLNGLHEIQISTSPDLCNIRHRHDLTQVLNEVVICPDDCNGLIWMKWYDMVVKCCWHLKHCGSTGLGRQENKLDPKIACWELQDMKHMIEGINNASHVFRGAWDACAQAREAQFVTHCWLTSCKYSTH